MKAEEIIISEKKEEEENKTEIKEVQFKKQLKTLQQALDKVESLKNIVSENAQKLTTTIYQLEYILNTLYKICVVPEQIKIIKCDLLGLYGDIQCFRSFHLKFTLETSFYENLKTIQCLYNFFKQVNEKESKNQDFNLLKFLLYNQTFEDLYNQTKVVRDAFNCTSGTNYCTLPNYLFCTLNEKRGFSLWTELFPFDFEVQNCIFVQVYSQYCGIESEKIDEMIQILDWHNDRRIDIYQFIQFLEDYQWYFDEQDKIIESKVQYLQREIIIKARLQKKAPQLNEDGSYTLNSGMKYYGEFDSFYQRIGLGKLIDKEYEFEGEFKDDLPTGVGKEIRNQVIYEGEFKEGLYDGQGVLIFPNGRKYTGQFKKHKFHGQGELIGDDGIVYKGEWVNGQLTIGMICYHDGSYYTGGLKGTFFKNGKGQYFNSDAYPLYDGEWENDKPVFGKLYDFSEYNQLLYSGQFDNYAISGKGERQYKEGKYIGQLIRDKKHGEGEFFYTDGSKYEGEWFNDVQLKGTFYYNINDQQFYYKGEWKNGFQEGFGKHSYPSGGTYEGYFKEGKRHGFGIYYYSNGNKYLGNWDNNQQEGDGKFVFSSGESQGTQGDIYKGQFKQGKFEGFGFYLYKKTGKSFTGFWSNDTWKGNGIVKNYSNGNIIKCGEWEGEKFIKQIDQKNLGFPDNWEKYTNLND